MTKFFDTPTPAKGIVSFFQNFLLALTKSKIYGNPNRKKGGRVTEPTMLSLLRRPPHRAVAALAG
jgi:hypothetical protein